MDSRPIGVFDSGLGGLTAVKKLIQLLPNEDIVYLGDTGRVPYGSRSRETIVKYAREDTAFLLSQNVKAVVVACNTASAAAWREICAMSQEIPFYNVVTPASLAAASATQNGKIGVIGTVATVRSGAYERALALTGKARAVIQVAAPLLVPLVENGRTSPDDVVVSTIVREYVEPIVRAGADAVILGCTHYPLLRAALARAFGGDVALIDSAACTAETLARDFTANGQTGSALPGTRRYFVTDSTEGFSEMASRFLESDLTGEIAQISLEEAPEIKHKLGG
ncbi:MAG: glutamate racemase [Oscillospiraceae bacterium]|jgi:glutamate racemase|nr:glutamate racemase [Oscillospiraceae bacterium]